MRDITRYEEPTRNYLPSDEELELFHGYEEEFDKELYSHEGAHGDDGRYSRYREREEPFELYTESEDGLLDGNINLELEGSAYPRISCVTPGNPYVLHCFPPFKTDITKDQHHHLDIIARKIGRSFSTPRPITKVMIVGHSSTWKRTAPKDLDLRAFQRSGNASNELILRLHQIRLAKRVDISTDGRSDTVRWLGKPYSSTSGSRKAQSDRALNRRVEQQFWVNG